MKKYDEMVTSFYKKLNIKQKADMLKLLKKDFIVSNCNHNLDYPYPLHSKKIRINSETGKIYLNCDFQSKTEAFTELYNTIKNLHNIKL